MSQPAAFNRTTDFSDYATANPSAPFNGALLDVEIIGIETTLDQINTNLALIQRDDGLLANLSVHPDALSTATKALIASDWTPQGAWATLTVYAVGDVVEEAGVSYVCATAHTAGTFSTDRTAGKWIVISQAVSTIAIVDGSFTILGSSDATKIARFECDTNITAGQTRVFTFPDVNGTLATINNAQTFTAKPTFDSSVEIGGSDGADTLTVNAATWTLGSNVTATRAAGALAAGSVSTVKGVVTFSGDSGGTTNARLLEDAVTSSGANAISEATARYLTYTHAGSATLGVMRGMFAGLVVSSTGNVTTARGVAQSYAITGAGVVTTGDCFIATTPILSSTGSITTHTGFKAQNLGHATLVGTAVGFKADDITASATAARGMQLSLSAGTGKHNLYVDGTAPSHFASPLHAGHTAAITVNGVSTQRVQVTGNASTGGVVVGAFANGTGGPGLTLIKSRNTSPGSFTVVQADDELGGIFFCGDDGADYASVGAIIRAFVDGSPGSNDMPSRLVFSTTADAAASATERMRITSTGNVLIGDTANANMTLGVTINQGAADNQIFALKSSDVATGLSSIVLGADVETDDFFTMQKYSATLGGLHAQVLAESTATESMMLDVWGGAPATTDTSASLGCINIFGGQHDGSNADADMAGDSNLLVVGEIDASGARLTRMILKADDGELHLGNTTLVALDYEDDIMAVRGLQIARTDGRGIAASEYDMPAYRYERLRGLGIVGERDGRGEFMIRVQPYLNLHDGALWQLYTMNRRLEARLAQLEGRL